MRNSCSINDNSCSKDIKIINLLNSYNLCASHLTRFSTYFQTSSLTTSYFPPSSVAAEASMPVQPSITSAPRDVSRPSDIINTASSTSITNHVSLIAMYLSPHFSLEEFTYSSTALARGIDNSLNPENPAHAKIISNLRNLCEQVLEPLRLYANESSSYKGDKRGSVPVIISSGYRCPQLNKLVGGSSTSQHMTGEACDIHISDQKKLREWVTWLMDNVNADQLILERASETSNHYWIHVSCKSDPSKNRHQVKFITKS